MQAISQQADELSKEQSGCPTDKYRRPFNVPALALPRASQGEDAPSSGATSSPRSLTTVTRSTSMASPRPLKCLASALPGTALILMPSVSTVLESVPTASTASKLIRPSQIDKACSAMSPRSLETAISMSASSPRGTQLSFSITPRQRVALGLDPSPTGSSSSGMGGGVSSIISPGRMSQSNIVLPDLNGSRRISLEEMAAIGTTGASS